MLVIQLPVSLHFEILAVTVVRDQSRRGRPVISAPEILTARQVDFPLTKEMIYRLSTRKQNIGRRPRRNHSPAFQSKVSLADYGLLLPATDLFEKMFVRPMKMKT